MAGKTQPFGTVNDTPLGLSFSPDVSYLRDNIAVPTKTIGRSVSVVATNARTEIESRLPTNLTLTTGDTLTPASANE